MREALLAWRLLRIILRQEGEGKDLSLSLRLRFQGGKADHFSVFSRRSLVLDDMSSGRRPSNAMPTSIHYKTHMPARFSVDDQMAEVRFFVN